MLRSEVASVRGGDGHGEELVLTWKSNDAHALKSVCSWLHNLLWRRWGRVCVYGLTHSGVLTVGEAETKSSPVTAAATPLS